jgi:mannitol/fructose-specific phosphotransferase system IIA component (Ntr-type)
VFAERLRVTAAAVEESWAAKLVSVEGAWRDTLACHKQEAADQLAQRLEEARQRDEEVQRQVAEREQVSSARAIVPEP